MFAFCHARGFLGAALCAAVLSLAACSPEYDWRTIQNNEGSYAVMFPAKPTSAERKVQIGGQALPMTMHAAKVNNAMFAVGVVDLPTDDAALRASALQAMQQGLQANLQGGTREEKAISGNSAATPPVPWQGVALKITGRTQDDATPRRMTAYLTAKGTHAYQVMVLETGPSATTDKLAEQTEQFLKSFQPF